MNLYAKKARLQTVISKQMFTKLSFFSSSEFLLILNQNLLFIIFFVIALFEITNYGKKEKKEGKEEKKVEKEEGKTSTRKKKHQEKRKNGKDKRKNSKEKK